MGLVIELMQLSNDELKKITAILFLGILIFNAGGYRLYFDQLESIATNQLIDRLDKNNYADNELIEIRVPLRLPYNINWTNFERIDGEIEWNGKNYNYVKRKFQNDTLIVLCIPSLEKTKINQAQNQFFSIVNDLQQDAGKQRSDLPLKLIKLITAEYISNAYYKIPSLELLNSSTKNNGTNYNLLSGFISCTDQPPDLSC